MDERASKNVTDLTAFTPAASCLCAGQGNVQARLRPGIWLPGLRALHQYQERWLVSSNPAVALDDSIQAVKKLRARNHHGVVFHLNLVADNSMEVLVFTRCRYVYVLRLSFAVAADSGCEVTARAFCSGLLPAWVPLCFLFSCLFFFVPVVDCGKSSFWLQSLRSEITLPLIVKERKRKC